MEDACILGVNAGGGEEHAGLFLRHACHAVGWEVHGNDEGCMGGAHGGADEGKRFDEGGGGGLGHILPATEVWWGGAVPASGIAPFEQQHAHDWGTLAVLGKPCALCVAVMHPGGATMIVPCGCRCCMLLHRL